VGQRFTSKTHVVDAVQIKAFARQFDPQPFHLDDDAAKDSLFSGLVASGWQTAAITMRLLVEGGLPLAGGVVGAGGELSWPRPTRPGDVLQVESEVLEIIPSRSRPDRGVARIRIIALMVASQLLIPAANGVAASKGAGASGTGGNCMYCILKCHGYLTAEPDCVKICNDNGCSWPAAKAQVSNLSHLQKQKN
jgi:acyl dehydratase